MRRAKAVAVVVFVCASACNGLTGVRYGTLAAGNGWTETEGILTPNDDKVAHTNGVDNPITIGGFGFNLPASARIDGIELELRRNAVGLLSDGAVALPKGNPKSNGAWPQSDFGGAYVATKYGGPTDTWGASWTASDVNANAFAVLVKPKGGGDGHADSLGVTVYYCE